MSAGRLRIRVPAKLQPVFVGPARYRCAYGGRGSGKTRTFATMAAIIGAKAAAGGRTGVIVCAREFQNSLRDSSFSEVAAAIAENEWLSTQYDVGETYIRTRCGRVDFVFIGLRHNLNSVKSKAKVLLCWVDEAEHVSDAAWQKLIPTVREEGSEIWVTWNPERKGSPTDLRFRHAADADIKTVEMNYRDNPWFPGVLEAERQRDKVNRPDQYAHIWEGDYATARTGAYYAADLMRAREQGRIVKRLSFDPLLPIRSYHDIGGAGAKADNYVIWITQSVGERILWLDHYTAQGQPIAAHVHWMRRRGWERAEIHLPHDGVHKDALASSWEDHWRDAGFFARSIPNQGPGAAMLRIENARRWFSRMEFDEERTENGRLMLGLYAPKIHEATGMDLGPDHTHSHDADAFGLGASDYRPPRTSDDAPLRPAFGTVA